MCVSVIAATGGGGGYVSSDDQQVSLAGGEYVSSDGHQVSLAGGGYVPVMATRGMSRGMGYVQRGMGVYPERICLGSVFHGTWDNHPPPLLTPSDGHQNTYGWQADSMHPTGMLSCFLCVENQEPIFVMSLS